MSDEAGVRIRYSLPDPEYRALKRIAAAIPSDVPRDSVATAMIEWLTAGAPAVAGTPPCELDPYSLAVWRAVRWWLRRSPALEILAPAKLAAEAIAKQDVDVPGMHAALAQLRRIAEDLQHPQHLEAREQVFALVPEPLRSQMRAAAASAELLAGQAARGAKA